ncbi:MAG: hypothetical protein DMG24_04555 [Acidobacteria bacterium]|nr:MAG: hypothetical protein DMG24_04555 [Acidobacteriota bacterium]
MLLVLFAAVAEINSQPARTQARPATPAYHLLKKTVLGGEGFGTTSPATARRAASISRAALT